MRTDIDRLKEAVDSLWRAVDELQKELGQLRLTCRSHERPKGEAED